MSTGLPPVDHPLTIQMELGLAGAMRQVIRGRLRDWRWQISQGVELDEWSSQFEGQLIDMLAVLDAIPEMKQIDEALGRRAPEIARILLAKSARTKQ